MQLDDSQVRWLSVTLGLALVLSLPACSSRTHEKSHQPHSSASTPLAGPDAARQAAVDSYRAMWRDMVTAGQTADFQSPALARHASGDALSLLVKGLYDAKQRSVVIKGQPAMSPQVTSLDPSLNPTEADLVDCFDDSHWLEYKPNGELADNTPGGRRHVEAIVKLNGGVWKVDKLAVNAEGTC